ncbi:sulfotransferase family protein [Aestuariivita boseongensis]|uniref:sulfotransferase family protein n=1 Tax=Aestuariivita boseongensis TaxID=1470562 RepID=UPI0006825E6E|nr:sulfotransferase family protein [Aestuariivita boseongensis]
MPRRLVIHAGFHKTGTTTIQQTLKLNRPVLKPVLRSVMRPGMKDLVVAARGFSTDGDALSRAKFHNRFGSFLYEQPPMRRRVLCLSAEELSGHLPGRPKVPDYRAAIKLAQDMAAGAHLVFPYAVLVFFFTTRNPDDWLQSAWSEHVKSSSMTMSLDEFATKYRAAADLEGVVSEVAAAVSAKVVHSRLEETTGDTFGPATRLLDICEVPQDVRDQMTRPEPANRRPDQDIMAALLDANRTIRDKAALKTAKEQILAAAKGP